MGFSSGQGFNGLNLRLDSARLAYVNKRAPQEPEKYVDRVCVHGNIFRQSLGVHMIVHSMYLRVIA
jgi:hypothetical protein